MRSMTVIHRKLADIPRTPRRRPAVDRRSRPLAEELDALASRVAALSPNWRDQERFHAEKGEITARLRALVWRARHGAS